MTIVKDFIFKIASELNYELREISLDESSVIRKAIFEKYKVSDSGLFLWDSFIPDSYLSNRDDSWLFLDEFIQLQETLLFFDRKVESSFFHFSKGQSIVSFLKKYQQDEFYLTNSNLDYLICSTDTGHLIASGTARSWLEKSDLAVKVS